MFIILILWMTLILIGIKQNKEVFDTSFTLNKSTALRGICSIEIMIGHLGVATNSIVLFPNRKAGILFVGVFFVLSGYGLMYSLANKDGYLVSFLSNRMRKILIPAYVVFVVSIILHCIISQNMWNIVKIIDLKEFFWQTNWYVWELLMLYIVFYISVRINKNPKRFHLIVLAFSVVFICVAYRLKFDNPWYGSTLCFWLGIVYFLYRDKFKEIFILRYPLIKIMGCCFVMTISFVLFFIRGGVIGLLISRNFASVFFVIILIIGLHKFSIGNNISLWLGEYSYEIFLFHPVFISILRPWIKNDVIFAWAVIGITILASYLYGVCERKLMSIAKKNHRKDDTPNHH